MTFLVARFQTTHKWRFWSGNLLLLGGWLWLYRAVFIHLQTIFSDEDFLVNRLLLIGTLLLFAVQFYRARPPWRRIDPLPRVRLPALGLTMVGSILYLLAERFLDMPALSTALFVLSTYGLLGLWLTPSQWEAGLSAALLLIAVLPFGDQLQTFIGYPLRLITAAIIRDGLQAFGIQVVGMDTLLLLEKGTAKIDLACSGIKSLWTGLTFLLAVTWIERRAINLRWGGLTLLLGFLIFIANTARIAFIVVADIILQQPRLAQLVHVPLGMLILIGACIVPIPLLRRQPLLTAGDSESNQRASNWLAPALFILALGLGFLYTPRPLPALNPPPAWEIPSEFNLTATSLQPTQIEWFARSGAESVTVWNFDRQGLQGTLILVPNAGWDPQARPERNLEIDGFILESTAILLPASDFPIHHSTFTNGSEKRSAVYWFQSADRVTDDYITRIWDSTASNWTLVIISFDQLHAPQDPPLAEFITRLRDLIELRGKK